MPDWKGLGYRLPTEAEWEYACRAKNPMRYSFGDDPASLDGHAWVDSNSGGLTHPVGTKKPNRFGLFDMHGSVWEWCSDGFANDFYARSPANDPVGPLRVSERVIRGGSWTFDAIRAVGGQVQELSRLSVSLPGVSPRARPVWPQVEGKPKPDPRSSSKVLRGTNRCPHAENRDAPSF